MAYIILTYFKSWVSVTWSVSFAKQFWRWNQEALSLQWITVSQVWGLWSCADAESSSITLIYTLV